MKAASLTIMFFISVDCLAQLFPVKGQLASTAFPVCTAGTFKQLIVPMGSTHIMRLPNCTADSMEYLDTNPFWYSFTCFTGGTLGFQITPNDPGDDYDWMIYDITGHDPDDAYTTVGLIVSGNWAGTPGLTGARNGGNDRIECATFPPDSITTFSSMPLLAEGHHYLLFISHYNQTESGYSLYFGGGTAIISDSGTKPLRASFTTNGGVCPQDLISFNNTSTGDPVSWYWNFGDGSISEDKNPDNHLFPHVNGVKIFNVSLIAENSNGCMDTATAQITKLQNCEVVVPNAFTPNGDGLNDYLYPLNALGLNDLEFRVFNRFGQLIFESRDAAKKWDGRLDGQMQPTGTYIWLLRYTDYSGRRVNETGSTLLIR